ncbi:hypothetical protein I3F58_07295 [Streptomyces sp. MUM 203J]|uniref:hypothetical protein n=1 Tax=Streptomyces sp. MUM 203J TaxID=2791990 RepID=UPI001F04B46E|nr:hypothetical protein [Streptomyces sp. MUM 203J]MCH0539368.1 hypothetical protein [Streptomyces sp. MUM 203J]
MNTPPVPLPAERIPPGTAEWRSADARRWLAAVPAPWAHPLWATGALAAATVWTMESGPEQPCTTASPCGAEDWLGFAFFAVLLLTFYWLWRQPRLALAGLGGLLAAFLVGGDDAGDVVADPSGLGFTAALAFAAAGLGHRLSAAARQRALAREAAGPVVAPLPDAARGFRRGRVSLVLAALLLASAGYGYWQVTDEIAAYEERAARLVPVTAEVTANRVNDDEVDVLTLDTGSLGTRTVETLYPGDFPVGSRVDVLVDGDWTRLVAEPYDTVDGELLTLAALVAGLGFFANGVDGRSRAERLRRGPLPVLKVLVREGEDDGRVWVYAADDPTGARPLLHFHTLYASDGEEDEEEDADGEGDAREGLRRLGAILKGEEPPAPLREAVLYGVPYAGAELAFVAREDEDDAEVSVECSVTAVKPVVPKLLTGRAPRPERKVPGSPSDGRPAHGRTTPPQRPIQEIAAGMAPTAAPRVWSAHGMSRAVGLCLLAFQGGSIWGIVDDGLSWSWLLLPLTVPWLTKSVSTALGWRVTADRDGVWITGPWRVRHLPWDAVAAVWHKEDGIRIDPVKGERIGLSPTGWSWLERRLGREPHAQRTADELRALLYDQGLRPLEEAGPGQQGMPLGPVLVAVSVVWGTAVLLLL